MGHDHASGVSAKLNQAFAALLVQHALLIHTNIQILTTC